MGGNNRSGSGISETFIGFIKNVKIYKKVMGDAEAWANYTSCSGAPADTTNLVLWTRLENGSGSVVSDSSRFATNGLMTSGAGWGGGVGLATNGNCLVEQQGVLCNTRTVTVPVVKGYRYGFNGKENDNEPKGIEGSQQGYGMRIYDPRLGRFLSVDPLYKEFPWYTPYQFAGNKPIWAIDLDGAEELTSTRKGLSFFPIIAPIKAKTAGQLMHQQFSKSAKAFSESRTGKFLGGAWNLTTGTVGTIASVSYIGASDGAGAALGGTLALQFSLGEMAIGTSQMIDAVFSKKTNDALQNSGSIPGLIAYGSGSRYAPFIDALGQFTPTLAASGSIKGLLKSGLGVLDAAKTLNNTPTIANSIALLDQISDTKGFLLESFQLASDVKGSSIRQKLSYAFSYTVQKGDNLSKIAERFKTTVGAIGQQNGLKNANKIEEGQKLKFSGVTYGGGSFGGAGSGGSTTN